jgi:uncharacterized protein DUF1579
MLGKRRAFALAANAIICAGAVAAAPTSSPPPFVVRGMPGDGQKAMQALAGNWRVEMTLYAAMGSPQHPLTSSDLVAHREWIGGGRFLRDVTEGAFGGSPYYRMGTLGYSNMDRRFEWVTQDALNANMMIYQGARQSGPGFPASLAGTFTDQGLLGEASAGKTIRQRTLIQIDGPDRNVMEIYFTPPGGRERLVDRKVYTRIKG